MTPRGHLILPPIRYQNRIMYSLFKPILFALDPERAHDLTLANLEFISHRPWLVAPLNRAFGSNVPDLPVNCMGIDFRHPVGLAAGLDKDARALAAFSALGFSAVEMGTVTPKPQPGNDKPRIFRLIKDEALINRLGFNRDRKSVGQYIFAHAINMLLNGTNELLA